MISTGTIGRDRRKRSAVPAEHSDTSSAAAPGRCGSSIARQLGVDHREPRGVEIGRFCPHRLERPADTGEHQAAKQAVAASRALRRSRRPATPPTGAARSCARGCSRRTRSGCRRAMRCAIQPPSDWPKRSKRASPPAATTRAIRLSRPSSGRYSIAVDRAGFGQPVRRSRRVPSIAPSAPGSRTSGGRQLRGACRR